MKNPILYRILRPILTLIFKLLYRPTIIGKNNIPKTGGLVLAGNHTNNFDCILLIASTKRTIHFLAKDELIKGWKKIIFKNMGIIPVNRKIHDKNALIKAIETLNKDKVIGIFPEGTINKTEDTIMPFKIGAVKMAKETDSYIVPFTITGNYKLGKKNIKIEFYKPYKTTKDLDYENNKLMEIIKTNLEKKGKNKDENIRK